MESKEIVTTSFLNACRACMTISGSHSIFNSSEDIKYSITNIREMMIAVSRTDVTQNDGLPEKICEICLNSLEKAFQFQKMCLDSYGKMKNMLNCSSNQNIQNDILNIEMESESENEDVFNLPESGNKQEIDDQYTIEHVDVNLVNNTDFDYEETINSDEILMNCNEPPLSQNCKEKTPEKTDSQTTMHKCDVCGKEFDNKNRFRFHLKIHTAKSTTAFQNPSVLKVNQSLRTGERPLCSLCGKSFSSSYYFKDHIMRHSVVRPFQCEECGLKFRLKSDLRKHISAIHLKKRPYSCDLCDMSFTQSHVLLAHRRTHTGEKPFSCDVCDMRFNRKEHLKRHRRTHTGERPYACKFCHRRYAQKNELNTHLRTHLGEKIYQCSDCTETFKFKNELKDHMTKHFKNSQQIKS